jgi:hypothetical protein
VHEIDIKIWRIDQDKSSSPFLLTTGSISIKSSIHRGIIFYHGFGFHAGNLLRHSQAYEVIQRNSILGRHELGLVFERGCES